MSDLLDAICGRILELPEEQRSSLIRDALAFTKKMVWVPNPGPQTIARENLADELFYGGQAGGGKSDLVCGAAIEDHERSLILRRFNDDAKVLAERTKQMLSGADIGFSYNGQDQILRTERKLMEYGGCKDIEDRQRYKGDPHDLIGFDEIGDFLEAQYTFIIGWNRSATPGQRSRIICTGNPPTTPEGLWVIRRWGAWLDPSHKKFGKVKEGELLWYTTINGTDTEVDGPGPHVIEGEAKPVMARSRTFIRARLSDNPDLDRTNYDAVLAGMPEELRLAYREGRFDAGLKDRPFQLIPSAWARAAQERWTPQPPIGVPMCAIAVDCTGGGVDPMVIGARHDAWFDKMIVIPGDKIPAESAGRSAAGYVFTHRRDNSIVIVDMGGGYGGPLYEHLHDNLDRNPTIEPLVKPYKGSEGSVRRTHDQQLGFHNIRTEALWRVRELLDPGQAGGSPAQLPPDPELLGDLTAITYEVRRGIIHAEPKEAVCARLGRSTNKGDTVCMAWTAGPIASTDGAAWDVFRRNSEMGIGGRTARPQVNRGRQPLTRRR